MIDDRLKRQVANVPLCDETGGWGILMVTSERRHASEPLQQSPELRTSKNIQPVYIVQC